MAQITILLSNDAYTAMVESFAGHFGYQPTLPQEEGEPLPNPQTKDEFTKTKILAYVQGVITERQQNLAVAAARLAAADGVAALVADVAVEAKLG